MAASASDQSAAAICDADGVCCIVPQATDLEQPSKPAGAVLPLLFGDDYSTTILKDDAGVQQSAGALGGKIVGLYFSASWCPPCRKFSPELSKLRAAHSADFAVVFVSCDRSEAEMKSFIEMKGFLHIPFHSAARRAIQEKLGVSMLPTLVIVDATSGKVLTDWGRAAVTRNPKGCVKSWKAGGNGCSWVQLLTGGGCSVQ